MVSSKELHMKQRRVCHEGTGLWALQSSQYLRWKAKSSFRALCCYGIRSSPLMLLDLIAGTNLLVLFIAGCGKSVLVQVNEICQLCEPG